jgi:[protein-PII] uridylyltransferase
MASKVGRRLQLASKQKRALIALVDNHGLLSKTAQSRNLEDPETIRSFCDLLQSPEHLGPLMLVTLADGQGTSDTDWSDWKEGLVWQLYRSARAYFEEGAEYFEKQRVGLEVLKKEVRAKLAADYADEMEAHFAQMPERYFRTFTASEIAGHVRTFRKFYRQETAGERGALSPVTKWIHHPGLGHSEVLVCGWDHPGFIRRICGAFLSARINVLSADIHTRADNLVLDIFRVCDAKHEPVASERDHKLVEKLLDESLSDPDFDFTPHIAKARQKIAYRMSLEADIPTRISIDNHGHPSFTIVDIQTSDRIGLLYDLFGALADLGLSLELARITTEKEVALDTFYVYRSSDGAKPSGEDEIRELQRVLQKAATDVDAAAP